MAVDSVVRRRGSGAAGLCVRPDESSRLLRAESSDAVKIRALVFSVKQCGTPAGGMLAGSVLPPLMLLYDWKVALSALLVLSILFAALAPAGSLGRPQGASQMGSPRAGAWSSLRLVLSDPAIRAVTASGVCLGIAQMGIATYLVVFLWKEVGYAPDQAGLVFSALHMSGIASRVVLGALTDRLASAKWVLFSICTVMAAGLYLMTEVSSGWSIGAGLWPRRRGRGQR